MARIYEDEKQVLRDKLANCEAIAWDTCHKIYVIMDEVELELMRGYGYTSIVLAKDVKSDVLFDVVLDWYDKACPLRFITAVSGGSDFFGIVEQR